MVFAIAFSGVLQSGMTGAVVSLILVSWPKYARLARNRVLALKHMPFIAARAYRKRNMEDDQTPYSAESCGADDCHSGA